MKVGHFLFHYENKAVALWVKAYCKSRGCSNKEVGGAEAVFSHFTIFR